MAVKHKEYKLESITFLTFLANLLVLSQGENVIRVVVRGMQQSFGNQDFIESLATNLGNASIVLRTKACR